MPYPIFSNSRAGDAVKIINSFFPKGTVKLGIIRLANGETMGHTCKTKYPERGFGIIAYIWGR